MKHAWIPALSIACLFFGACSNSAETATTQSNDAVTTTTSDTPTVVFDGETCSYEGPLEVPNGGLILVTLENSSDIDIDAGVFRIYSETALTAALDRLPPGSGSDILLGAPPGSQQEAWLQAPAAGSNKESLLLEIGLYLIDCARIPYGDTLPDYVWRGGSFEVVSDG
jgi:hypothetical protein